MVSLISISISLCMRCPVPPTPLLPSRLTGPLYDPEYFHFESFLASVTIMMGCTLCFICPPPQLGFEVLRTRTVFHSSSYLWQLLRYLANICTLCPHGNRATVSEISCTAEVTSSYLPIPFSQLCSLLYAENQHLSCYVHRGFLLLSSRGEERPSLFHKG